RLARLPLRALDDIGMLAVVAETARCPRAETVDPHLAERVVEDRGTVATRPALHNLIAPVNAVLGEGNRQSPAALYAVRQEEVEAPWRIFFVVIQPHSCRVASCRVDDVGALLHIEGRLFPANPIGRRGVTGRADQAAHVPQLEQAILRVVPDTVAED